MTNGGSSETISRKPFTSADIIAAEKYETQRRAKKAAKNRGNWKDTQFTQIAGTKKKDPESVQVPTGLPTGYKSTGKSTEGYSTNPENIVIKKGK